jgi:thiol-disulfide isomerase/thioredoxin
VDYRSDQHQITDSPLTTVIVHANRRTIVALVILAALTALTGCTKPAHSVAPKPADLAALPASDAVADSVVAVAWKHASNDADIDAAFAAARASNMPVFVYWGARWCPPCNLVKATVFNRQDFIERSRAFVPVYVDGDSPGAQKLGARFNVSGYPTMVLFSPQGAELTRLPGEVDAARYTEVLTLGMNALRPVKEVLAQALHGTAGDRQPLNADDWRLLAFYSWDTDEQQLVPKDSLGEVLGHLADALRAMHGLHPSRLSVSPASGQGRTWRRPWLLNLSGDIPYEIEIRTGHCRSGRRRQHAGGNEHDERPIRDLTSTLYR